MCKLLITMLPTKQVSLQRVQCIFGEGGEMSVDAERASGTGGKQIRRYRIWGMGFSHKMALAQEVLNARIESLLRMAPPHARATPFCNATAEAMVTAQLVDEKLPGLPQAKLDAALDTLSPQLERLLANVTYEDSQSGAPRLTREMGRLIPHPIEVFKQQNTSLNPSRPSGAHLLHGLEHGRERAPPFLGNKCAPERRAQT